ncbi:MAG: SurA N-terminal domain-containing protein [Muribaculaceae bacterium]|nr:SurA N-terminal domain-containing protein [Muribaculaceae bacterium]
MATLEKIRSKSVLLLVVIFAALLAFILGDAITNGRNLFGNQSTVAKVGGQKIDYLDYQRKREELSQQLEEARKQNPEQYASFDVQRLPQMAVNQLISEMLLKDGVKSLGLQASPEQLRQYLFNSNPTPEMINVVRQLQGLGVNITSVEQAHEVIFNPKRNGLTQAQVEPLQQMWLQLEKQASEQIVQQTYVQLLAGTIRANDLDKKALYNDYIAMTNVSVAYRPYGQVDEKKYPVSDEEINKAYNEDKNLFRVEEPTKEVSFVAVNVSPSEADREAANKLAIATAEALRDTAGGLTKDLRKEGLNIERRTLKGADLPGGAVKEFVATAPHDSVSIVTNNLRGFTVVKMGKRYLDVDSVQLNLVTVMGSALPAKVLTSLNSGLPVDSLVKTYSADSVMTQTDQWLTLYSDKGRTNDLPQAQLDSLRAASGRYIKLMSSADGAVLAQLAKTGAPVEIYEYEVVDYALQPSAKTLEEQREKLEKFLAENNTAAAFTKNAEAAGYNLQNYQLTQSSDAVPRMPGYTMYYPDSRQVVRWVMIDGKPGKVSHVYQSNDMQQPMLYAVAVNSAYDDYIPVSNKEVKEYLTQKIRNSKAGDDMIKQYQAKAGSMASVATAMGVEPRDIEQFRFGPRAGVNAPKVIGMIAGGKADKKVVLVKADDGVYAFEIKGRSNDKLAYDANTYEQQYRQMINPQLEQMLRGAKKIKNSVYKFEAGD